MANKTTGPRRVYNNKTLTAIRTPGSCTLPPYKTFFKPMGPLIDKSCTHGQWLTNINQNRGHVNRIIFVHLSQESAFAVTEH
jgi:hypothetical protein